MGHSFGGYIMAHYALRYPHLVDNLYLLSPLGVTYKSPHKVKEMQEKYNELGFM